MLHFDTIGSFNQSCASLISKMSLPEEQSPLKEPSSHIGRKQLGLAASFVTPSLKKGNKGGNGFINEEPFIDTRKPSSMKIEKNT
jgi:hypothetical protein